MIFKDILTFLNNTIILMADGKKRNGSDGSDGLTIPNTEINMALINSLIDNGWDGEFEKKKGTIVIELDDKAQTLAERINDRPFEYYEAQRLAICLAVQMEQLFKIHKSYLFFDLEDISIIDENWYIINTKHLPVEESYQMGKLLASEIYKYVQTGNTTFNRLATDENNTRVFEVSSILKN